MLEHKFKIKHYYKVHTQKKKFKVPAPFLPLPIPLPRTATYKSSTFFSWCYDNDYNTMLVLTAASCCLSLHIFY